MKKILITVLLVLTVSFTLSIQSVRAEDGIDDTPVIDTIEEETIDEEILTEFDLQLEQIKAIIISIIAGVVGTGIFGLIIKVALDKLLKKVLAKITQAEEANKISQSQAQALIAGVALFKGEVFTQIEGLEKTVTKFIEAQDTTNKSVEELLAEFKAREETLKELLEQDLGE